MERLVSSSQDLGQAIRERRKEFGLTQEQLANASGLTRKTVSEIEASGEGRVASVLRLMEMLCLKLTVMGPPVVEPPADEEEIGVDFSFT